MRGLLISVWKFVILPALIGGFVGVELARIEKKVDSIELRLEMIEGFINNGGF